MVPVSVAQRPTILAPHIEINGTAHEAMLLAMASVPLRLLTGMEPNVVRHEDAISAGLDAIFRGYPVRLSIASQR